MQDDAPHYDLDRLAHIVAEEALGERYFYHYRDLGDVESFSNDIITIRRGRYFHSDHLLFLAAGGERIAVDEYGVAYRYTTKNTRIERVLANIIGDALRTYREREEPPHLETEEWELPDFPWELNQGTLSGHML